MRISLILLLLLLLHHSVRADPDGIRVTQSMAMGFNTTIPKSFVNQPFYLKQYFVPESWASVERDLSTDLTWERFVHSPNRPGMVRVLIHPMDHISAEKIESSLRKYNFPYEPTTFAEPLFLTESRSLYPVNYKSGETPISPRLSLTQGFGKWAGHEEDRDAHGNGVTRYNKLISSAQAQFALYASELIQKKLGGVSGLYFGIQPDRMILKVRSPDGILDLGETFRDISSVVASGEYNVPGFIDQHRRGGLLLALANKKLNSFEYLRDTEGPIRGRMLAEFYARTGFVHSSPHSQNLLIVTDQDFKVTGTAKLRDLADLIPTYDSRLKDPAMAELFNQFSDARAALNENLDGGESNFVFRHSFFKGSYGINLLQASEIKEVETSVSDSFFKTLAELAGVSPKELLAVRTLDFSGVLDGSDYAKSFVDRKSAVWEALTSGLDRYRKSAQPPHRFKSEEPPIENSKIEKFLKSLITQALKGEMISEKDHRRVAKIWRLRDSYSLSKFEREFLVSTIITADLIPTGEAGIFYLEMMGEDGQSPPHSAKRILKELFFENIAKRPEYIVEFLNFVTTQNLAQKLNAEDSKELKGFVESVITSIEKSQVKPSREVYEVLYFSWASLVDENHVARLSSSFIKIAKRYGLPEKVREDLASRPYKSYFEFQREEALAHRVFRTSCEELFY